MDVLTQLADDGMSGVLVVLLPLGVLVFVGACVAFAWAARSRQFDNLEVEAQRILFETSGDGARTPAAAHDAAERRVGDVPP